MRIPTSQPLTAEGSLITGASATRTRKLVEHQFDLDRYRHLCQLLLPSYQRLTTLRCDFPPVTLSKDTLTSASPTAGEDPRRHFGGSPAGIIVDHELPPSAGHRSAAEGDRVQAPDHHRVATATDQSGRAAG